MIRVESLRGTKTNDPIAYIRDHQRSTRMLYRKSKISLDVRKSGSSVLDADHRIFKGLVRLVVHDAALYEQLGLKG